MDNLPSVESMRPNGVRKFKLSRGRAKSKRVSQEEKLAIRELLIAAHRFEDKPHLLFEQVNKLAWKYEKDQRTRFEILHLMDIAGQSAIIPPC